MSTSKILLIDTLPEIKLLQESIVDIKIPVSIQYVTSISDIENSIHTDNPDLIMIGSSLVIQEGFETFLKLGDMPIVILCESYGLSRFLNERASNVCFITKPLDIDRIPDMIEKAYEFMLSCKEI